MEATLAKNFSMNDVLQDFLHSYRFARCVSFLEERELIPMLVEVLRAASAAALALQCDKAYLARDLCSALGWQGWPKRRQVCAGICLSYLVERQAVPLQLHRTRSGRGPRRYTRVAAGGGERLCKPSNF